MADIQERARELANQHVLEEMSPEADKLMSNANTPKKVASEESLVSQDLVNFVADYERFKPEAYYDKEGSVWTIGHGLTQYTDGTPVKEGDTIEEKDSLEQLKVHLNRRAATVKAGVPVSLKQNELDAFTSLLYNSGNTWDSLMGSLSKDGAARTALARRDIDGVVSGLFDPQEGIRKAGGATLEGLQRRRLDEMDIFYAGDYSRKNYTSSSSRIPDLAQKNKPDLPERKPLTPSE